MLIRTLQPWGGHDFSLAAGDVIDVPDATARDRIAAGLADAVDPAPTPKRGK